MKKTVLKAILTVALLASASRPSRPAIPSAELARTFSVVALRSSVRPSAATKQPRAPLRCAAQDRAEARRRERRFLAFQVSLRGYRASARLCAAWPSYSLTEL